MEQILCDADLDYLGRTDFYAIGQTLYQELRHFEVVGNEQDWNRLQVRFLEVHHFFTHTNMVTKEPQKQVYLRELKATVAAY